MLETAIANPGNYLRMDALFNDHPRYIKIFQDLIFEMSYQLRMISKAGNDKKKLPGNDTMRQCFEDVRLEIDLLREALDYEEYLMLQNLLEYQEKQFEKLKRIKWLLGDPNTAEIDFVDRKAAKRFVAFQDYDPMLLLRNLSFKSTIFRHSFRMANVKIEKNLEGVLQCLKDKKCKLAKVSPEVDALFEEQLPAFDALEIRNLASNDKQSIRDLQEMHLVWEQLKWLFSISGKMLKLAASVKLD
jgi:hypothetical protein